MRPLAMPVAGICVGSLFDDVRTIVEASNAEEAEALALTSPALLHNPSPLLILPARKLSAPAENHRTR